MYYETSVDVKTQQGVVIVWVWGNGKSEATSRVMQRLEGVGFMTVRVHGALYTPCQNIVAKI